MARRKKRVYLAGPISGCNPEQIRRWRARVRERWSREFAFVDPADDPLDAAEAYQIVHRDDRAIASADAVLANMWKESIGTAIGVALARARGKVVVVVDPNRLQSRILAFYADAVEETLDGAMKTLRALLRSEDTLRQVLKHDGTEEKFDRAKIVASVRRACRAAGKDDILAPAEVVPRVVAILVKARKPSQGTVSSTQIRSAVWDVLAEVEADPLRLDDFAGIRGAWERHDAERKGAGVGGGVVPDGRGEAEPDAVRVHSRPLAARVFSGKSHASIWGFAIKRVDDIPQPARRLFLEILRVEGIAEIRLTKKGSATVTDGDVWGEILASRTPGVIEGKCFHDGGAGQVQMFQVRVHDASATEAVRMELVRLLAAEGLVRGG